MKRIYQLLLITTILVVGTLQLGANSALEIGPTGTILTSKTVDFATYGKLTIAGINVKALPNADNTSDANKPISIATQAALDLKLDLDGDGSALTGLTKAQVGLSNVQNVDQTVADNLTSGTVPAARLPVFVGDSGSGGTKGAVPAPGVGDATKALKGDGTWANLASMSGGTVTSFSFTNANGITGVVTDPTNDPVLELNMTDIKPTSVWLLGTLGAGYIDMPTQTIAPATPATDHMRLFINQFGILTYKDSSATMHVVDKTGIGLGNVDNTSDVNKPVSTAQAAALALKESLSNKNQGNGYAGLDSSKKISVAEIPTGIPEANVLNLVTDLTARQLISQKNAASGYAGLDGSTKLTRTQMPVAVGVGAFHAIGAVPDPGAAGSGLNTDYLGRSMSYYHKQPITPQTVSGTNIDWLVSENRFLKMTGDMTLTFTNVTPGDHVRLVVTNGSSWTMTWPSVAGSVPVVWSGGIGVTHSGTDMFVFYDSYDGDGNETIFAFREGTGFN